MGQQIEIKSSVVIDNMLVIDTNRSITGQNGESFDSGDDMSAGTLPAKLAQAVFSQLESIDYVYAASNSVALRSSGEWEPEAVDSANSAVRNFFTYWSDNRT